jgi:amino acid permease
MAISLYTTKIIIFVIITLYFNALGKKLDDLESKTPFRFIFIPFYLIAIIVIIWGILYIYSIKKFELKYKSFLYIIVCILVLCTCFVAVIVPLMLDKKIKLNALYPACNNILISIMIFLHYFLVRNQNFNKIIEEKNYDAIKVETLENNDIN